MNTNDKEAYKGEAENVARTPKKRALVLIDGANHTHALSRLNKRMDYKVLAKYLEEQFDIVSLRYYTGKPINNPQFQSFLNTLSYNGYIVVDKEPKHISDGTVKGNLDVEIAVDAMTYSEHVDVVILFSGDSDFVYLLDALQKKGIRCYVVSGSLVVSEEIRKQADVYWPLIEIAGVYEAPPRERTKT